MWPSTTGGNGNFSLIIDNQALVQREQNYRYSYELLIENNINRQGEVLKHYVNFGYDLPQVLTFPPLILPSGNYSKTAQYRLFSYCSSLIQSPEF